LDDKIMAEGVFRELPFVADADRAIFGVYLLI
jgi:hypothetical protein